jgi:hypothetical protein
MLLIAVRSLFNLSAMWSRLIRFSLYNIVFALLPLIISASIRQIASLATPAGVYAPEILFFAVMISATALGDISDEVKVTGSSPFFQLLRGALMLGAIASAALFGMYQYDQIVGPGFPPFRENITWYAIAMGVVFLIFSVVAEVLLGRIQGRAP